MLKIENLKINIDQKNILHDINMEVNDHEIVALIGPNGTGKTTLLKAILSHYLIKKETGKIYLNNQDITNLSTSEVAQKHVHLMQQNPEFIAGLKTIDLLQVLVQNQDKTKEMSDFYVKVLKRLKDLNLNNDILQREINLNWSGGERKKFQVLLMELVEPKLLLIDEIDTALDVDALNKVCTLIKEYYDKHPDMSILVISHSNYIFNYLKPHKVYLISNKTIAAQGDYSLVQKVQEEGYAKYQNKQDEERSEQNDFVDPLKGL